MKVGFSHYKVNFLPKAEKQKNGDYWDGWVDFDEETVNVSLVKPSGLPHSWQHTLHIALHELFHCVEEEFNLEMNHVFLDQFTRALAQIVSDNNLLDEKSCLRLLKKLQKV